MKKTIYIVKLLDEKVKCRVIDIWDLDYLDVGLVENHLELFGEFGKQSLVAIKLGLLELEDEVRIGDLVEVFLKSAFYQTFILILMHKE